MSERQESADRKVTFAEVLGVAEFRAVFAAAMLAEVGDFMSKAAVTAMVFFVTDSVALSAAAFAVSYAPWIVGGPVLTALAERLPYRAVMVAADALRAVIIATVVVVALTLLPSTTTAADGEVPPAIWLIIFLLFLQALVAPAALAARSAIMPLILEGDRVTLGIATTQTGRQAAQVAGYMSGALIAVIDPAVALTINAAIYMVTALIVRFGVRHRAPALRAEHRSHLLRETAEGFRVVFGTPTLRAIAIVVFASMLFSIVPEGLAIGWAQDLAGNDPDRRGLYQGLIMIAQPVGQAIAALLVVRLLRPTIRSRLVRYLIVAAPLALVPAVFEPGIAVVVAITMISGMVIASMLATLNGIFVQILQHGYRARAFGVMNSGMQVLQGSAVLAVGAIVGTGVLPLPVVVGLWSAGGVVLMLALAIRWPGADVFSDAIAAAEVANEAAVAAAEEQAASRTPTPRPTAEPKR